MLIRKIGEGILAGGLVLLLFIAAFETRIELPAWLQVVGRMHPMLLHFPIVLLILSLLTFWLPESLKQKVLIEYLLLFAAVTAVITALMGLLLSFEEQRGGSSFIFHKWGGILIAVLSVILYFGYGWLNRRKLVAKPLTLATAGVILATGHWGADLTHGENFLLQPMGLNEVQKASLDQAVAFDDVILPLFNEKCVSCHGESSIKGGLALHDSIAIWKGGKTGPLLTEGDLMSSLLIKRLHLPVDDKKHMPPKNKPQLNEFELSLIEAWVKGGAIFNQKVVDLPLKDSFRLLASKYLGPAEEDVQQQYTFAAAPLEQLQELNNNNRVIEQLGANSPAVAVNFYGKTMYTPKAVEDLLKIKEQVVELNLSRMPVKNDDLKSVSQLPNLRKLNLNYTDVDDRGVLQLVKLINLQELSLSGTAVTSKSLQQLLRLPNLHSVYLWNTKVDSSQLLALNKQNKAVSLELGYKDDGSVVLPLNPPMIQTNSGVFDNQTQIALKHPFKGVQIKYTMDGSLPDSSNGLIYKEPISLTNTSTLKTRAFKEGWLGSEVAEALYIRRGIKPDSVRLVSTPHPEYNGTGKLMSDADLADTDFKSGKWLGYRGDASLYMYLDKPSALNRIVVNLLRFTDAEIFPPVKVSVWGGADEKNMRLLGSVNPPAAEKKNMPGIFRIEVEAKAENIRCIKVVAAPLNKMPAWHPNKGKPAWLFISELIAE